VKVVSRAGERVENSYPPMESSVCNSLMVTLDNDELNTHT